MGLGSGALIWLLNGTYQRHQLQRRYIAPQLDVAVKYFKLGAWAHGLGLWGSYLASKNYLPATSSWGEIYCGLTGKYLPATSTACKMWLFKNYFSELLFFQDQEFLWIFIWKFLSPKSAITTEILSQVKILLANVPLKGPCPFTQHM